MKVIPETRRSFELNYISTSYLISTENQNNYVCNPLFSLKKKGGIDFRSHYVHHATCFPDRLCCSNNYGQTIMFC